MFCFQTQPCLKIKVKTWEKSTHNLFDYQSNEIIKEKFEITEPSKIWWDNKGIKTQIETSQAILFQSSLKDSNNKRSLMGSVQHSSSTQKNKNFIFHPLYCKLKEHDLNQKAEKEGKSKKIQTSYVVVKSHENKNKITGYPLRFGNIIRLGIIEFRVIEINTKNLHQRIATQGWLHIGVFNQFATQNENCGRKVLDLVQQKEGSCKFCLSEEQTSNDPFISPCKCAGSCSTVHISCLKNWMSTKVKRQVKGMVSSLNFAKFQCEICKEPYPVMIKCRDRPFSMIETDRPQKPYLVLQVVNRKQVNSNGKLIHIISPSQADEVRIGRSQQCQILVDDKSISRMHSLIKFVDGEYYILDCNSRFGTLVKLEESVDVGKRLTLQVGRSLLELTPN